MFALYDYWQKHPPIHKLAAAYMGFKPKDETRSDDFAEFLAAVQQQV